MDTENMQFTDMEIDAIGELMNISLGSSATSVSGMLNKRVNITAPHVEVLSPSQFEFQSYEPAIGVEINYVSGLTGTNIMILKMSDVEVIVGLLLGTDYTTEEFVMDDMSISAICEVMNQMMGASATALSDFLGRPVNISTPTTFEINNSEEFKKKYFVDENPIVSVYFKLMIEDLINSEFISVLPMELARELVASLNASFEEPVAAAPPEPPKPTAPPKPIAASPAQAPAAVPARGTAPVVPQKEEEPAYEVRQASFHTFEDSQTQLNEEQATNLDLILSVPLQISVEIGRTKQQIKDILEYHAGTIVELNKQAGAHVDIYANGQPIAKGDVVVVDDFYGVRITEILSKSEIIKML